MIVFLVGLLLMDANALLRDAKMLKRNLKSCVGFCLELKEKLAQRTCS